MAIFRFLRRFGQDNIVKSGIFCTFATLFFPEKHPTMKRLIAIITCLLLSSVAFSQDNEGFFKRLRNQFVVHDTIIIYIHNNDTIIPNDADSGEEDEDEEEVVISEGIPVPIDTLDTHEMFRKVVLFDNGTWLYYNIDIPYLPYELESDYWNTERVHSFNDVALKDLPDSVQLILVDSIHHYCIPHPGRVTSRYKYRWKRAHKGIDLGLHTGDAIYAAFDGIVRVALPINMTGGYGNVLVIRHFNGLETYYGHLSHFIVKSGDIVKAGELIGYGGSTGRSTGPHLHFETRYMGQAFDPERIFDFENGMLRTEVFTLKKHYFNINSHYGQTDEQSLAASKKKPISSGGGGSSYYKVRKGDTLEKIAKKNGTTVEKICRLNGIKKNKTLKIGQKLRVR